MKDNILQTIGVNEVNRDKLRDYFREFFLRRIGEQVLRGESVDGWAKQSIDMVNEALDHLEEEFKPQQKENEKNTIAR